MKRRIKNLLIQAVALLLIFALGGCGSYVPPIDPDGDPECNKHVDTDGDGICDTVGCDVKVEPENPDDPTPENPDNPDSPDTPEEEPDLFTASLKYNGTLFIPTEEISVQWSDGASIVRAPIDSDGVASAEGLDGDYTVTLTGLPDGYSYNPNIYTASNNKKHVDIVLEKLKTYTGSGRNMYSGIIEISEMGVYRVKIDRKSQIVYFQFKPESAGSYAIESWVNVSDDRINPIINIHAGTTEWKNPTAEVVDGGGVSNDYASNFVFRQFVDASMISDSGGAVVYAFGVRATTKDEQYPVYVDFSLEYKGAYSQDRGNAELMIPTELPKTTAEETAYFALHNSHTGPIVGPEKVVSGNRIFDTTMYKLNEEDGYYHRYDEELYADTDGWGPILYAYISEKCRFIGDAFINVEYMGNTALTVSDGTENYNLFIEGAKHLYDMGEQVYGAPTIYEGYENTKGYNDFVNKDGLCPVTAELKDFLQKYSVSQRLFMDGNGYAEISVTPTFDSDEDSQWLFACCYYAD